MDGRNEIVFREWRAGQPARHFGSNRLFLPARCRSSHPSTTVRAGKPNRRRAMRSLAHELAAQRTGTQPRHETWNDVPSHAVSWDPPGQWDGPSHLDAPAGTSRRAVLRRALRQGLLRPAQRPGRPASLRSSRMGEAGKADPSSGARRLESL